MSTISPLPEALLSFIDKYLHYLKYERGYAKHTLLTYQGALNALAKFIVAQDINDWQQVEQNALKQWLIELKQRKLKPRSIHLKLSSIKGFFNYLCQKEFIQHNPAELLAGPKSDKPLPKNLEVDELSQLLAFTPESTIEYRDKAIMELFYSSGIRLSELADIRLRDMDLHISELRVRGKGSKERVVPIGRKALTAIDAWLKVRDEFNQSQTDHLFLSKLGNAISTRQIQQRLKIWATKQGLSDTLHPHKLRHSFASHILQSSSDLRAVQELLGHANLATTQVYTHLDFQHLAKVYDNAHPRAKNKK